jgi:hypothetical protein
MHVKVTLLTRAGRFVGRTEIAHFQPPAEVLLWRARTFQLSGGSVSRGWEYREVIPFHVVKLLDHEKGDRG